MTYSDDWLTIHVGDNRAILPTLPDGSVHCVVTSPPYWGLRDYGTATWDGGDPDCDHRPPKDIQAAAVTPSRLGGGKSTQADAEASRSSYRDTCSKCGAIRQDAQLGLERTPEEYVANMVAVFREVRRVMRDDATLWLNLGDTFMSSGGERQYGSSDGGTGRGPGARRHKVLGAIKPKDLVGIPWRVAFALQADGWYLRSDIIWAKPNPMPESVTDRPTKSHEYLFLLAKSDRYFFDADAVRLPVSENWRPGGGAPVPEMGDHRKEDGTRGHQTQRVYEVAKGANIRSVWTIATQPYPGSHFATFPPKLVEPCIKAGTSERGVCPECGAPWRRVVERDKPDTSRYAGRYQKPLDGLRRDGSHPNLPRGSDPIATTTATGWRPTCDHEGTPVPATVMDPFGGSGTTAMVAQSLSRRAVLIELNPGYVDQALGRNAAVPLGLDAA